MATFNEISEKICSELPEYFEISVSLEKDAGYVELYDRRSGRYIEYPTDYSSLIQQMEDALEYAKQATQ